MSSVAISLVMVRARRPSLGLILLNMMERLGLRAVSMIRMGAIIEALDADANAEAVFGFGSHKIEYQHNKNKTKTVTYIFESAE